MDLFVILLIIALCGRIGLRRTSMQKYRYSTIQEKFGYDEPDCRLLTTEWFKQMRAEAVTSRVLCFKTKRLLCETNDKGEITYAYMGCEKLRGDDNE